MGYRLGRERVGCGGREGGRDSPPLAWAGTSMGSRRNNMEMKARRV